MATSKGKKSKVLGEVKDILGGSANMVLTEYRGMNVAQMTALRSDLRKAGMKFKIMKNTLMKKLIKEQGLQNLDAQLHGPVGVAFLGKDVAYGSKVIVDSTKKNPMFLVKAGLIEGKVVDMEGIKVLASLPPREVMLAILLGTMQAPLRGFMTVARGNTQKLVYALNALKDQKSKAA